MYKTIFSTLVALTLVATPAFAQVTDVDPLGDSSCANIAISLRYGMRDTVRNDVFLLQDFLNSRGYLLAQPTGFFGKQTLAAVLAFQKANDITPSGFVGPITRAKIADIDCNGSSPTNPTTPSFSYTGGSLASPVYFYVSDGTCTYGPPYTIEFGDGERGTLSLNSTSATTNGTTVGGGLCAGYFAMHTYKQAGTYTAKLMKTVYNTCSTGVAACAGWYSREEQVGSLLVNISGSMNPTSPLSLTSLSPSSGKVGTSITLTGAGFGAGNVVLIDGMYSIPVYPTSFSSITFTMPSYISGPCGTGTCVTPFTGSVGTHTVAVKDANSTSNALSFTILGDTTPTPTTVNFTSNGNRLGSPTTFYVTDGSPCAYTSPYTIEFGDGGRGTFSQNVGSAANTYGGGGYGTCAGYFTMHTYSQAGTYTAKLIKTEYNTCATGVAACTNWYSREVQVGTLTITISGVSNPAYPPSISYLSPTSGAVGTKVYVYGSNFLTQGAVCTAVYPSTCTGIEGGTNTIRFNGVVVAQVAADSTGGLTFTVPSVAPGTYPVTVENKNGSTSSSASFTVTSTTNPTSPVALTSLSPSSGKVGTSITLTGAGFGAGNVVLIDGMYSIPVYPTSFSSITFTMPSYISGPCGTGTCVTPFTGSVGTHTVAVKDANSTSNALSFTITSDTTTPGSGLLTYKKNIAGLSPLYVQFMAPADSAGYCNDFPYTIEFGDGTQGDFSANTLSSTATGGTSMNYCAGYLATHTYQQSGTYTVKLYKTPPYSCPSPYACTAVMPTPVLVDTITITVGVYATNQVLGASTMCVDIPVNLHRGMESPYVVMLQKFLVTRGLMIDSPTGFYGDVTVSAVNAYQTMKGLPVTGMVYDYTRQAIKNETCG